MNLQEFWNNMHYHAQLPFIVEDVDYVQEDGLIVMKNGRLYKVDFELLPEPEDYPITIRELAKQFPAMYNYYYKWRNTETPELEKDINEVLLFLGYKFKNQEDSAGEYNDLKGYLECEVIPV